MWDISQRHRNNQTSCNDDFRSATRPIYIHDVSLCSIILVHNSPTETHALFFALTHELIARRMEAV